VEWVDLPPVVPSSDFTRWSADREAWLGSALTPTTEPAQENDWSSTTAPASLPQPNQFLALVLLGWVTVGIGILCRLSREECQHRTEHQG
jgi:hypothetical protein